MEVLQHEHPLTLIDLNPQYPRDEVVYDDEEELIKKQDFRCPCGRCGQEINFYHRRYYTCDQCDYSLHKLCAELPTTLRHESHRDHKLILCQVSKDKPCMCQACKRKHDYEYLNYHCVQCDIYTCLGCSKNGEKNHMIYHPSHQHPIISISVVILANCHACGNKHQGNFYQCITCFNFFVHRDCVFLRKKLLIQNFRNDGFFHIHPLTLTYSFSKDDQKAKFYPKCKVCELGFDEDLWVYKCEKCRYYVHTDCATTSKKASVNATGLDQDSVRELNFSIRGKQPYVLDLPFRDQNDMLMRLKLHGESGSNAFETNLSHPFHPHPLTLVDTSTSSRRTTPYTDPKEFSGYSNPLHFLMRNTDPKEFSRYSDLKNRSNKLKYSDALHLLMPSHKPHLRTTSSIHDSKKVVEVMCNACVRPITNIPFYKCTTSDDGCNFVLHASCTRLPTKIKLKDYFSEIYDFELLPKAPGSYMGLFKCHYCKKICNGFVYNCRNDNRQGDDNNIDVHCALSRQYITHKSHPNHLLRKGEPGSGDYCRLCLSDAKKQICYSCEPCQFIIHSDCALLWPQKISHKYDKHLMTLRYFPVENHSGDYFCEVCEEEFNPNGAFYHCDQCVQSMHPACCVSIPTKETTYTPFYLHAGVDRYDNVKFGQKFMVKGHPHAISFCLGVRSDGKCPRCLEHLEGRLTLKCLTCTLAIDISCAMKHKHSRKPIDLFDYDNSRDDKQTLDDIRAVRSALSRPLL